MVIAEHCAKLARHDAITTALEAYRTILHAGKPDELLGRSIQIGLEAIDPTIDIKETGNITLKAIKDAVVAMAKKTWELIKELFDLLNSLWVKFTGSLKKVRSRQKNLAARIGRLGSKVAYKKLEISGINRLSVDGQFVGADPTSLDQINQLTDYILTKHPRGVVQIARTISKTFQELSDKSKGLSREEIIAASMGLFGAAVAQHLHAPVGDTAVEGKELPSSVTDGSGDAHWHRSVILPGNFALIYLPFNEAAKQHTGEVSTATKAVKATFALKFTELQLKTAESKSYQIDAPSVQVLQELNEKISSILTMAERGSTGHADFANVRNVVNDTIRQIAEGDSEVTPGDSAIVQVLGAVSEVLAEPMEPYTHWLAVTLNIYLGFMEHAVSQYEKSGV